MAKVNKITPKTSQKTRPAISTENRYNQLVSKALDEAERMMDEHTASSQIITQFIKYGTEKAKLEAEKLRYETELIQAKKLALESQQTSESLYADAIKAFRTYSGQGGDDDDYDYDY